MENYKKELFNYNSKSSNVDENLLFQQYKLFLELTDKVSDRRNLANQFFLTINGALVAGLINILSHKIVKDDFRGWVLIAIATGLLFCFCWRRIIFYYKNLNSGKFHIIQLLEEKLPANLYKVEWDYLKNKRKHVSFSDSEKLIPAIFVFLYLLILFNALQLPWLLIIVCAISISSLFNIIFN